MKVEHLEAIPSEVVTMPGAERVRMRILIGEADGAPNFVMRQFEVEPGGFTPKHHHPYEHQIYVLEGKGIVLEGDQARPLEAGDCVYVASDEVHQFRNTGELPLKFLCLIPRLDKCGL